jgi:Zn-dependent protease
MASNRNGSIHLFRFAGVNVFLHWSWFVVAYFQIGYRANLPNGYTSWHWMALEYLALFAIVLLHEFGHALACRSVGGRADQIILWPLGGVAFVDPPPRPGATLWSIAAGPLVNVGLMPVLVVLWMLGKALHWHELDPNLFNFISMLCLMNGALFCFNMLPIFPLDGGQILQSILWFWLGRARSLMVTSAIGLAASVAAIVLLLVYARGEIWLLIMAVFVVFNCWRGLQQARAMSRVDTAPRRLELACPKCKASPPVGNYWGCGRCRAGFDIFATRGVCPNCGTIFNEVRCQECGETSPLYSFNKTGS